MKTLSRSIKKTWLALFLLAVVFIFAAFINAEANDTPGNAAWLIDLDKYFAGAHGTVACLECHKDIKGIEYHPIPLEIKQKPPRISSDKACLSCHEKISVDLGLGQVPDLEKKTHGMVTVKKLSAFADCIRCHDPHYNARLNPRKKDQGPFAKDRECLDCHQLPDTSTIQGRELITSFCLDCHPAGTSSEAALSKVSVTDLDGLTDSEHKDLSCLDCHAKSVDYGHDEQDPGLCLSCHKQTRIIKEHDRHQFVDCQVCHVNGLTPFLDKGPDENSSRIIGKVADPSIVHGLVLEKEGLCETCHYQGNDLGASIHTPPVKGILCLSCHVSLPVIGSSITGYALLLFFIGLFLIFIPWPRSRKQTRSEKSFLSFLSRLFSYRFLIVWRVFLFDAPLNIRLFSVSKIRWFIHELILLPLWSRFFLGLIVLIFTIMYPEAEMVRFFLDSGEGGVPFFFELTGLMMLTGIICAGIKGIASRKNRSPHLPGPDWAGISLLTIMVLSGFLFGGMNLAAMGLVSKWHFYGPFVSQALAFLFINIDFSKNSISSFLLVMKYAHLISAALFIAYLPFSRMIHLILAPVSLAMKAVREYDKEVSRVK